MRGTMIGAGYVDDCAMLAFTVSTGYTYNGTTNPIPNNSFGLEFSLRTLGPNVLASGGY